MTMAARSVTVAPPASRPRMPVTRPSSMSSSPTRRRSCGHAGGQPVRDDELGRHRGGAVRGRPLAERHAIGPDQERPAAVDPERPGGDRVEAAHDDRGRSRDGAGRRLPRVAVGPVNSVSPGPSRSSVETPAAAVGSQTWGMRPPRSTPSAPRRRRPRCRSGRPTAPCCARRPGGARPRRSRAARGRPSRAAPRPASSRCRSRRGSRCSCRCRPAASSGGRRRRRGRRSRRGSARRPGRRS